MLMHLITENFTLAAFLKRILIFKDQNFKRLWIPFLLKSTNIMEKFITQCHSYLPLKISRNYISIFISSFFKLYSFC